MSLQGNNHGAQRSASRSLLALNIYIYMYMYTHIYVSGDTEFRGSSDNKSKFLWEANDAENYSCIVDCCGLESWCCFCLYPTNNIKSLLDSIVHVRVPVCVFCTKYLYVCGVCLCILSRISMSGCGCLSMYIVSSVSHVCVDRPHFYTRRASPPLPSSYAFSLLLCSLLLYPLRTMVQQKASLELPQCDVREIWGLRWCTGVLRLRALRYQRGEGMSVCVWRVVEH